MGFQATTSIAKKYGRTVNQMKLILAEEGLLGEAPGPRMGRAGSIRLLSLRKNI